VLTYRGSGVINVATGAEAMAAGYAFYSLRTVTGAPLALLGTLAFTVSLGVAIELLAFRPLRTASPLARLVASLGVLLTLQASATLIYGTGAKPAPSVLPHNVVRVTNVAIPADRFWLPASSSSSRSASRSPIGTRASGSPRARRARVRSRRSSPVSARASCRSSTPCSAP
jgi:branched-chain amino acid transport system permease protein